jgi:carbonic anhydrase
MSFSWAPFSRTYEDASQPAPETVPPPQPAPAPAPRALRREPARGLAIVACMDCRIDPLAAVGLSLGDAVVLRNAGAEISDDMLRSLKIAQDALGVRTVYVIAHTDCAAHGGDDDVAVAEAERGVERVAAVMPNVHVEVGLLDTATGSLR